MIMVDPSRTVTALYNAMPHAILWDGLCDMDCMRAHTAGFDELENAVREYAPQAAAGRLECSTECGSCLPELKRMVNSRMEDRGWRVEAKPRQVSALGPLAQSSAPRVALPNPQS
jgi:anaerobic selenocysteine-containing dehydrogenase